IPVRVRRQTLVRLGSGKLGDLIGGGGVPGLLQGFVLPEVAQQGVGHLEDLWAVAPRGGQVLHLRSGPGSGGEPVSEGKELARGGTAEPVDRLFRVSDGGD